MFETITTKSNRTFKEINKDHDMICIEEINAVKIIVYRISAIKISYLATFEVNNRFYSSDGFKTEKEALKFRNEIMGWNNDKQEL